MTTPTGADLIATERRRQIEAEGWTAEHDAAYTDELVRAAVCYLTGDPADWPWHPDWWKPSDDPARNLAKAGALIAAEIDRLAADPFPMPDKAVTL